MSLHEHVTPWRVKHRWNQLWTWHQVSSVWLAKHVWKCSAAVLLPAIPPPFLSLPHTVLTLSFLLLLWSTSKHFSLCSPSSSDTRLLSLIYPPPHFTCTKSLLGYPFCFSSILHCSVTHLSFTSASLIISLPFTLSLPFRIQLRLTVYGFTEITYYNPAVLLFCVANNRNTARKINL